MQVYSKVGGCLFEWGFKDNPPYPIHSMTSPIVRWLSWSRTWALTNQRHVVKANTDGF